MTESLPVIAITPGEPTGIGPEIVIKAAQSSARASLVAIADPDLLERTARMLSIKIHLSDFDGRRHTPGRLQIVPVKTISRVTPGRPDPENARYVLETLDLAADGCLKGQFDAMVTGPVQKSTINDAGIPFTGHTEYLAERCGGAHPVMMLATDCLRVALYSTHIPLAAVPAALDSERLTRVISIIYNDLQSRFGIARPCISVCGLNPHAGEGGYLGHEEQEIIQPVIDSLRIKGINLIGPLPADTAFTHHALEGVDTVLTMYHDQGLPVIKHSGFGKVVNITLGLPVIRTSVDHGTALDLAGTGHARPDSLILAVHRAIDLCRFVNAA